MALSNGKKIIFAITAMFLASILGVTLIEIGFRIVRFQPRGRVAVPHEFRLSKMVNVPYELSPDHDYQWQYGARHLLDRGFKIPVTINHQGYRDDPLTEPKPEDEYRILALGDSFTWGLGVRVEDCWVEQLETMLNQNSIDADNFSGKRVEIVNTGVGSWNTVIEMEYLRQRGMKHHPDAVILGFLINDFRSGDTEYEIDDRGYLVTRGGNNPRLHLQSLLYEKDNDSGFFQGLMESSHLIRWASGRKIPSEKRMLMQFNDKASKKRTFDAIREIHSITSKADIPLYVCIFPYVADQIPDGDIADLREVGELCEELGVLWLPMETALIEHPAETLWVHPRDHHPNALAHHLYAKLMLKHFFQMK